MMKYNKEDIIRMAEEEDVEFIRLQFTDIFGVLKNMAVTVSPVSYTHLDVYKRQVDLVCHWLSDCFSLCSVSVHLSGGNLCDYWNSRNRPGCGNRVNHWIFIPAVPSL